MKFNRKLILTAIKDSGGIKKNIALRLGVSRPTLDEWIAKDPVVGEAFRDEKEKLKDLADERLIEQIQMGNLTAIIWYQKTQCRDRGYIEKQDVSVTLSQLAREMEKLPDADLLAVLGYEEEPAAAD